MVRWCIVRCELELRFVVSVLKADLNVVCKLSALALTTIAEKSLYLRREHTELVIEILRDINIIKSGRWRRKRYMR